ncbi:tripartite tricarboxylate transporter substrate binding protein [Roseibium sp. CAU 1637]|uniref:Tripartite tricarboxylate transporter substrate binding protein n=1 Tax=Roseibium limicola TaxID=2816037 RepID=A0A939J6N7_9HYPH|nr:tripartite tricarboxylate transporter substrate binding protein [Roseibium limicola]MBO0347045.1 tripartite tricarboxylate transporter substrate binding protein [Roseibium limicola]
MGIVKLLSAAAIAAATMTGTAFAEYPEQTITIIVPWSAGGGTDAAARTIGTILERDLGQKVSVINRTGGSGVVGHSAIAAAKPDGYTLGLITSEINMMHWMGLTELTHEAYAPLAMMNEDPAGVHVAATSPWNDLGAMVEDIRANPGKFKGTGTGIGGSWHLALAGLLNELDISADALPWIPSKGAATGLLDIVAGGAHVAPVSLPEAAALAEAGKLKTLAIMSNQRAENFPDVPTVEQAIGVPWSQGVWRGMVVPKGVDEAIVEKLSAAMEKIYKDPEYADFMQKRGFGLRYMGSAEFGEFLGEEDASMGVVLKAIGLAKQ